MPNCSIISCRSCSALIGAAALASVATRASALAPIDPAHRISFISPIPSIMRQGADRVVRPQIEDEDGAEIDHLPVRRKLDRDARRAARITARRLGGGIIDAPAVA